MKLKKSDFYSRQQTIQSKIALRWLSGHYDNILEIGCSSGYFTKHLTDKAQKVYGIDVNRVNIDIAKVKYPNVDFRVADASNLPFADESFEAVVMLEVFEHVEDKEKVIREIHRILKPGGRLILSTPNTGLCAFLDPFNLKVTLKRLFPNFAKVITAKIQRYRNTQYRDNLTWHGHYSLDSLKKYFKDSLTIVKIHRGGLIVFPLCSLLQSVLNRIIPSKFLFIILHELMTFDGTVNYGKWAYNLAVEARKV